MVGNHIRTDFQLHHGLFLVSHDGGTVTTTVNRTVNDGGFVLPTRQTDRHLLGIGTESIQGIYRRTTWYFCRIIVKIFK